MTEKKALETMLTTSEVMENLRISSPTTMNKLLELNDFPKIRIGKKYLIPENEYKKWLKQNMGTEVPL